MRVGAEEGIDAYLIKIITDHTQEKTPYTTIQLLGFGAIVCEF